MLLSVLGFAIGYSHADTPVQENQVGLYEPWFPIGPTWRPGVPSGAGCPDPGATGCTYYSDGIKALRRTGYTKRDAVLEIGPGRGVLTSLLAKRARRLIAIELDRVLAATYGPNHEYL